MPLSPEEVRAAIETVNRAEVQGVVYLRRDPAQKVWTAYDPTAKAGYQPPTERVWPITYLAQLLVNAVDDAKKQNAYTHVKGFSGLVNRMRGIRATPTSKLPADQVGTLIEAFARGDRSIADAISTIALMERTNLNFTPKDTNYNRESYPKAVAVLARKRALRRKQDLHEILHERVQFVWPQIVALGETITIPEELLTTKSMLASQTPVTLSNRSYAMMRFLEEKREDVTLEESTRNKAYVLAELVSTIRAQAEELVRADIKQVARTR